MCPKKDEYPALLKKADAEKDAEKSKAIAAELAASAEKTMKCAM